jgi:hypothetical protein
MTEAEWLACVDPAPMLVFLKGVSTDRKLRLFACACAREVEDVTIREGDISVSELVERYADGQARPSEMQIAAGDVKHAAYGQAYAIGDAFGVIQAALQFDAFESARDAAGWLRGFYSSDGQEAPGRLRPSAFCRDIVGNPFRPVAFDPAWLTSDVLLLARGIYEDRAFDRMPILADALQDAGCDNDDVLNHCRDPKATHVRGCWVVDLVLGKA